MTQLGTHMLRNLRHRLRPSLLVTPKVIRRGTRVSIVATAPGFEIRAVGKALMDGGMGDVITVRNLRSKRQVDAVVARAGVVEVNL